MKEFAVAAGIAAGCALMFSAAWAHIPLPAFIAQLIAGFGICIYCGLKK